MKAIGYIRISTDTDKQKHSLDAQEKKMLQYCEFKGYSLLSVVKEEGSGRRLSKRPKIQVLLDDVASAKWDVLVTTKIDRIARNIVELNQIVDTLKKNGKSIVFLENDIDTNTTNGWLMLNILGVLADWEARIISERTKEWLTEAKAKGIVLGRPLGREKKKEALMEEIRRLRKGRHSWAEIAQRLGYKSDQGAFIYWKRNKNPA